MKLKIGKNLAELRTRYHYTQDDLSEKLGVSSNTVSAWETDQTRPSLEHMIALTNLFEISLDALVCPKEERENTFPRRFIPFRFIRTTGLGYYPENIHRIRIAEKMHEYSASLQINYARCMTRKDTVSAQICRLRGMEAAMELFFLLKKVYPPYYKWMFRALQDIDEKGEFTSRIQELADEKCNLEAWEDTKYNPNRLNLKDRIVCLSEDIGYDLTELLKQEGYISRMNPYLEADVRKILDGIIRS